MQVLTYSRLGLYYLAEADGLECLLPDSISSVLGLQVCNATHLVF